jgi:hypothetical protein
MRKSLSRAYSSFGGMTQSQVPWLIWLLENPDSPVALAGAIPLREHDYLHLLLDRGKSAEDEAFVIGFTMGNDTRLNFVHTWIFKLASRFLYPKDYRFTKEHLKIFDQGVSMGEKLPIKNLCRFDYSYIDGVNVEQLRSALKIDEVLSP